MARIFSYDSKFSYIVFRIAYGCYLNALWLVCCLPIFTIGASTTALYYVALKIAGDEEGDVLQQFFRAFKNNFKQSTVVWLILLALGILLGVDIYVLLHLRASTTGVLAVTFTIALAVVFAACIALAIVLMYVFPLIARVENTNWNMIKNSLLIGTHYLFCTILVFAIHAAMAIAIISIFTPLIVFGEGLCAVLSSYLLLPVMRAVSKTPEEIEQMKSVEKIEEATEDDAE
ncbi:MAG: YesL family protein [Atopobiaceae bacterium]|nr:YesL family protein [Atopobiaceae bacterium]